METTKPRHSPKIIRSAIYRFKSLYIFSRILLGFSFTYAGVVKIISPIEFADAIAAYRFLPNVVINPFALGLPFFELTCGLMLLMGVACRTAAMGAIMMLIVFSIATFFAHFMGRIVDCGCFDTGSWLERNFVLVLLRDVVLLAAAIFVYVWSRSIETESLKEKA